jgi:hypothetical protein
LQARGFQAGQRGLQQPQRFRRATHLPQAHRHVVAGEGGFRVLVAKGRAPDRQRLLVQGEGPVVLAQ